MATLSLLACYAVTAVAFWLPGSLAGLRLAGRPGPLADLTALVINAGAALVAFWAWLAWPAAGAVWSWAWIMTGVVAGIRAASRRPAVLGEAFSPAVRGAGLLGLAYLCFVSLHGGVDAVQSSFVADTSEDAAASLFWLEQRSIDSLIPIKFARAVADGGPLRGAIGFGEWHFSDRPPLQVGMLLLFWPAAAVVGQGVLSQAVGTLAQAAGGVGLLALLAALGFSRRRAGYVAACLACTGLVYFSFVYVWPKLLAAGLWSAAAAALIAGRRRGRLEPLETVVAAAASALALLAHGTAAFSLLPLAAWAVTSPAARRAAIPGTVLAALVYLPWAGYQRWVDPPGDSCLKGVLTGCDFHDPRPFSECLAVSYGRATLGELAKARGTSLRTLVDDPILDHDIAEAGRGMRDPGHRPGFIDRYYAAAASQRPTLDTLAALLRYDQTETVFRSLGLLNLGWLCLAWQVVRRKGRAGRGVALLGGLSLASLGLWWLLVFWPDALIIRNSSHAMLLGLMATAAAALYDAGRLVRRGVLAAQATLTTVLWLVLVPSEYGRAHLGLTGAPQLLPAAVGLAALAGLALLARRGGPAYRGWRPPAAPWSRRRTLGTAAVAAAVFAVAAVGIGRHPLIKGVKLPRVPDHLDYSLEFINDVTTPIDEPPVRLPAGGQATLEGWAVDRQGGGVPVAVEAVVDGRRQLLASGMERPDVAKAFTVPGFARSGFRGRLDPSCLAPGPHELRLRLVLPSGDYLETPPYRLIVE